MRSPNQVCLQVTARAITYYLDVSNECTRRIIQVDGAVKAICSRLAAAEMTDRTSKDLGPFEFIGNLIYKPDQCFQRNNV